MYSKLPIPIVPLADGHCSIRFNAFIGQAFFRTAVNEIVYCLESVLSEEIIITEEINGINSHKTVP